MPPQITHFSRVHIPGRTLYVTAQRLDGTDRWFRPATSQWGVGLTFSQRLVAMTGLTGEYTGVYAAEISGLSGADGTVDPGLVRFYVHDADDTPANRVVGIVEGFVRNGALVRNDEPISSRASVSDIAQQVIAVLTSGLLLSDPSPLPGRNPSIAQALSLLYNTSRWRATSSDTQLRLFDANDRAYAVAELVSDDNKFERGPLQNT